eukprot:g1895.t1
MFVALYANFLEMRVILLSLRDQVSSFLDSLPPLYESLLSSGNFIQLYLQQKSVKKEHRDEAFDYLKAVRNIASDEMSENGQRNTRGLLEDHLLYMVLEPIRLQLDHLDDLENRLYERQKLKKVLAEKQKAWNKVLKKRSRFRKFSGTTSRQQQQQQLSPEKISLDTAQGKFQKISTRVFEELDALQVHRDDLIYGLFQTFKRCQLKFFSGGAAELRAIAHNRDTRADDPEMRYNVTSTTTSTSKVLGDTASQRASQTTSSTASDTATRIASEETLQIGETRIEQQKMTAPANTMTLSKEQTSPQPNPPTTKTEKNRTTRRDNNKQISLSTLTAKPNEQATATAKPRKEMDNNQEHFDLGQSTGQDIVMGGDESIAEALNNEGWADFFDHEQDSSNFRNDNILSPPKIPPMNFPFNPSDVGTNNPFSISINESKGSNSVVGSTIGTSLTTAVSTTVNNTNVSTTVKNTNVSTTVKNTNVSTTVGITVNTAEGTHAGGIESIERQPKKFIVESQGDTKDSGNVPKEKNNPHLNANLSGSDSEENGEIVMLDDGDYDSSDDDSDQEGSLDIDAIMAERRRTFSQGRKDTTSGETTDSGKTPPFGDAADNGRHDHSSSGKDILSKTVEENNSAADHSGTDGGASQNNVLLL